MAVGNAVGADQEDVDANTVAATAAAATAAAATAAALSNTDDISDRVLRAGDTLGGPLVGIAGSLAEPSLQVGPDGSGLYADSTHTLDVAIHGQHVATWYDSHAGGPWLELRGVSARSAAMSLKEAPNNGGHYTVLRAAASIIANYSIVLPNDISKGVGESLTVAYQGATTSYMGWSDDAIRHTKDGVNLVYNGANWKKDSVSNWGIPSVVGYNPADHAWLWTGSTNQTAYMDERFKLDPAKRLRFSFWEKGEGAAQVAGSNRWYAGVNFFDVYGNSINIAQQIWRSGSETTLTQPFALGDTVMHVADASGWVNFNAAAPYTSLIAFVDQHLGAEEGAFAERSGITSAHYMVGTGNDVPGIGGGYTVDPVANTITFDGPVTLAKLFQNGTDAWAIGDIVRQPQTRATNFYTHLNVHHSDVWTEQSYEFATFAAGTNDYYGYPRNAVEARIIFLAHYNTAGLEGTTKLRNIFASQP